MLIPFRLHQLRRNDSHCDIVYEISLLAYGVPGQPFTAGMAAGWLRLIVVSQKMRHTTTQQVAMRFTKRGAVRSRDSSTTQS